MISKKNNFFTFIFSLIPGAGQMYMGFMKRGLSLMSVFFLIIFSTIWLNIGPLFFIALIVWFYSFFDTHNLRSTPNDEFYNLEDSYLVFPNFLEEIAQKKLYKQHRNIIAVVLIIIGISILWSNFLSIFGGVLPDRLWHFLHSIGRYLPQLVIGVAIMLFGVYLIRGKKEELDSEELADYKDNDKTSYEAELGNYKDSAKTLYGGKLYNQELDKNETDDTTPSIDEVADRIEADDRIPNESNLDDE